jgi:hypothetical protein
VRVTASSSLLLRLATVGLVAVAATSLSGCGRRANPEVPGAPGARADRPIGIPIGPTAEETKPAPKEKKPFFLDPLL